jgi:hypothetical protein
MGYFGVDARGQPTTQDNSDRLWRALRLMQTQRDTARTQVAERDRIIADLRSQIQAMTVAQARALAAQAGGASS